MVGLAILAVLVVVAVVGYFQMRRHGQADVPADNWQRTTEVFRDPSSGRVTRVWVDPVDGSRHYVPE